VHVASELTDENHQSKPSSYSTHTVHQMTPNPEVLLNLPQSFELYVVIYL